MPASQRHFGLDWLRIGAFGILIFYHIGMAFSPWAWVVKTSRAHPALIPPMAAVTPWRLALLFAVSGYASARLFGRIVSPRRFAISRSWRLLVPLAFGMVAVVPLEMWVRVLENGYPHGYLRFWLHDYWRWGSFWGVGFPNWEHLWFVAYLWLYTMALAAALALAPRGVVTGLARLATWLAHGSRLLWVPICVLVLVRLSMQFVIPERSGLFTDFHGHAEFLPMFVFGFALAGNPVLWPALARWWRAALVVAAASGAAVIAVELAYQGDAVPPHVVMVADRTARLAMAWAMVLALFYLADRWLNRDAPLRRPLGQAVFPAYLVHHSVIVAATWFTLPLAIGAWTQAGIILLSTLAACTLAYLLARRFAWLGILLGVQPSRPAPLAPELRAA